MKTIQITIDKVFCSTDTARGDVVLVLDPFRIVFHKLNYSISSKPAALPDYFHRCAALHPFSSLAMVAIPSGMPIPKLTTLLAFSSKAARRAMTLRGPNSMG